MPRIIDLSDKPHHLLAYLAAIDLPGLAGHRIFYFTESNGTDAVRCRDLAERLAAVAACEPTPHDLIVMDRSTEIGRITRARATMIRGFLKDRDLPIKRFVYASQDRLAPARLTEVFREIGSEPPSWLWFHHYFAELVTRHAGRSGADAGLSRLAVRPPRFLCLNNKIRPHRVAVAAHILSRPRLKETAILSFNTARTKIFDMDRAIEEVEARLPGFSEVVRQQKENVLALEPIAAGGSHVQDLPDAAIARCLIILVTESEYRAVRRVTEKSMKAVIYGRPWLVVGPPGALSEMRDLGFETFGRLIDERYDDEVDHDRRALMVMAELEKLMAWLSDGKARRYFCDMASVISQTNRLHFESRLDRLLGERLEDGLKGILEAA